MSLFSISSHGQSRQQAVSVWIQTKHRKKLRWELYNRVRKSRERRPLLCPEFWSEVKVAQSCLTLCDLMDCSPWNSPGKNTGVGSLSLFQGIFPTRDQTQVSCIAGGFFTSWATREACAEFCSPPNPDIKILTSRAPECDCICRIFGNVLNIKRGYELGPNVLWPNKRLGMQTWGQRSCEDIGEGGHLQVKVGALEETDTGGILISDLYPGELWGSKFLLFKPLICSTVL